ncbi:MAG TPA: hypothetical protein VNO20_08255 [Solirubrobacterales bacterium]|nr:hypothetical protein [Solirubrobacterales bacterium]
MPNSNALDDSRADLEKHLANLDEERDRITQAIALLGSSGSSSSGKVARRGPGRPRGSGRRGPGRPPKAATATTAGRKPGRKRRRRGGTRADQAVSLVEANPGISASEIAKSMKIKPNYLYRVLSELEQEGRVTKKGRQYHPTK